LLGDDALVNSVLKDPLTSDLTEPEKVLFAFIDKVNTASPSISPADIEPLHQAGWPDPAIYDAITVCALFNFFNRWIDATGVHPMSDQAHRAAAKRMAVGYLRTPQS